MCHFKNPGKERVCTWVLLPCCMPGAVTNMNKLWSPPWRILQLSKGDRLKTRHRKRVWRGRNAQDTLGTSRKDEKDWVIGTEISLTASYRCSWRTKGELTRWIRESWTFQAEGTEWARLVGENLEEGCCDASRCFIQFSLAFPGEKWLFFLVGCIEEDSKEERRQDIQVTTVIICFRL